MTTPALPSARGNGARMSWQWNAPDGTSARASAIPSADRSMPTTRCPAAASVALSRPPPHPNSRIGAPPAFWPISASQRSSQGSLVAGNVARARRAGAELFRRHAAGIGERLLHGGDVGTEDALAVRHRPLLRRYDGVERALEARHHVARKQLVRAQDLLARRPLVGAEQHAAEPAVGEAEQPLDALGDGVGRADQGRALLHALAQRIVGAARRAAERVLEVGDGLMALTLVDLSQCFLVVVGDVAVHHDPPFAAIDDLAVLGRGLLVDAPLLA